VGRTDRRSGQQVALTSLLKNIPPCWWGARPHRSQSGSRTKPRPASCKNCGSRGTPCYVTDVFGSRKYFAGGWSSRLVDPICDLSASRESGSALPCRGDPSAQRRTACVVAGPAQRAEVHRRARSTLGARCDVVCCAVLAGEHHAATGARRTDGLGHHPRPRSSVLRPVRLPLLLCFRCPSCGCSTWPRVDGVLMQRRTRS